MYLWTSWILHLQLGTSKLYLEPLLKTFETPGAFIWNPYLEPWNLPKLYLRTFAGNLDRHLEPSRTYTLTWMEPICFTWNLGIFRNLYLEPLLGTSEPSGTLYDWNPYLEPRNLPEPLLGTLILGTSKPSEPYLEPLLGTSEPARTFTWNPYTWNLGTFGTLLGTLTWNLGTCRNLYLEPLLGISEPAGTFTWNPYLEPRSPPEPLLGTLTWNLGTCRNLYLEPLLGTSEPAGTFTWNPYLEPRNLPEPGGMTAPECPGLSLARTPKLSAVGEKNCLDFRQSGFLANFQQTLGAELAMSPNPQPSFQKTLVVASKKEISPCKTPTAMLSSQAKTNGVSKLTEIYKVPSLGTVVCLEPSLKILGLEP